VIPERKWFDAERVKWIQKNPVKDSFGLNLSLHRHTCWPDEAPVCDASGQIILKRIVNEAGKRIIYAVA
jgi:hypothetical protein